MTALPTLPRFLPLPDAVQQQRRFVGTVPGAGLDRLNSALAAPVPHLYAELQARPQSRLLGRVQGTVTGLARLNCQRCLEDFDHPLQASADWTLVGNEEDEARLMESCEPVLVEGERLDLWAAVEDEALLSLPLVPHCSNPACLARFATNNASDAEIGHTSGLSEDERQPFAALKAQWKGKA